MLEATHQTTVICQKKQHVVKVHSHPNVHFVVLSLDPKNNRKCYTLRDNCRIVYVCLCVDR